MLELVITIHTRERNVSREQRQRRSNERRIGKWNFWTGLLGVLLPNCCLLNGAACVCSRTGAGKAKRADIKQEHIRCCQLLYITTTLMRYHSKKTSTHVYSVLTLQKCFVLMAWQQSRHKHWSSLLGRPKINPVFCSEVAVLFKGSHSRSCFPDFTLIRFLYTCTHLTGCS